MSTTYFDFILRFKKALVNGEEVRKNILLGILDKIRDDQLPCRLYNASMDIYKIRIYACHHLDGLEALELYTNIHDILIYSVCCKLYMPEEGVSSEVLIYGAPRKITLTLSTESCPATKIHPRHPDCAAYNQDAILKRYKDA